MARRWRSVWHSCDTLHLWFWRWAVPWARLVLLFLWNVGVFCPWGWLRDIIVHGGWWKKVGLGSSRYRFLQKIWANLRESFDPVENLPEIEFRSRYRLWKDAFAFLWEELRQRTDLRVFAAFEPWKQGEYQFTVNHLSSAFVWRFVSFWK